MHRFLPTLLLAAAGLGMVEAGSFDYALGTPLSDVSDKKPANIQLTTVKLDDLLGKHLTQHKGKVVLIDIWGFYCPSCKEEFKNVLRFQQAYAAKGLVCMTISLDEEKDKPKALTFLKGQKAQFAHYWLEEGFDGAGKKWDFKIIPAVIVYGRDGQLAKVFKCVGDKDFTYDEVEAYLKKLL